MSCDFHCCNKITDAPWLCVMDHTYRTLIQWLYWKYRVSAHYSEYIGVCSAVLWQHQHNVSDVQVKVLLVEESFNLQCSSHSVNWCILHSVFCVYLTLLLLVVVVVGRGRHGGVHLSQPNCSQLFNGCQLLVTSHLMACPVICFVVLLLLLLHSKGEKKPNSITRHNYLVAGLL